MNAYVVDENVPIVANGEAAQADEVCRLSCIRALRAAVKTGIIFIDDAGELLANYRRYLDGRGQPGVGDAFLRHSATGTLIGVEFAEFG